MGCVASTTIENDHLRSQQPSVIGKDGQEGVKDEQKKKVPKKTINLVAWSTSEEPQCYERSLNQRYSVRVHRGDDDDVDEGCHHDENDAKKEQSSASSSSTNPKDESLPGRNRNERAALEVVNPFCGEDIISSGRRSLTVIVWESDHWRPTNHMQLSRNVPSCDGVQIIHIRDDDPRSPRHPGVPDSDDEMDPPPPPQTSNTLDSSPLSMVISNKRPPSPMGDSPI